VTTAAARRAEIPAIFATIQNELPHPTNSWPSRLACGEALGRSEAFGVVPVEEVKEGARASSNSGRLLDDVVVEAGPSNLRHSVTIHS